MTARSNLDAFAGLLLAAPLGAALWAPVLLAVWLIRGVAS